MGVYHGRTATLAQQFETTFRTPPASPNTQLLKFSTLTMGRQADLQDDPTINANALMEKRDEMDSTAPASIDAILCLNDIGTWLKMALGPAVVTGTGPYTHVFTLDLTDRPTSLLELSLSDSTPSTRFHRVLGMMLSKISWDIMDAAQSFKAELLGAIEVRPYPTTQFDTTPNALRAKNRGCTKNAKVWDGAALIGEIAKASIEFDNGLDPHSLADGQEGLGHILLGQPKVGGSMDMLFTPGTLVDDALARNSKHIVMVSKNAAGDASLTVDIPQAEWDVPQIQIPSSKGIVVTGLKWWAHKGSSPVTVTLVNGVTSY